MDVDDILIMVFLEMKIPIPLCHKTIFFLTSLIDPSDIDNITGSRVFYVNTYWLNILTFVVIGVSFQTNYFTLSPLTPDIISRF